jgi:hypothetical protein
MRPFFLTTVLLFLIFSLQPPAHGGAWPRKAGSGFLQLGFSTIGYDKTYADDGTKTPVGGKVRDNVIQLFADFGITDLLSVSAMVPLKFISTSDMTVGGAAPTQNPDNSGIGDIDVRFRYSLMQGGGYAVSGLLFFGLPAGDSEDSNGLLLGDGETNVGVGVSVGRSFYPFPLYANAELAYDVRSKGFSDDVLYSLELGYGVLDGKLFLILLFSGKESTSTKPTPATPASRFGLQTNNQEFASLVPKLFYKLGNGWALSAGYATAVHGRNVAGGAVLSAGLSYEF